MNKDIQKLIDDSKDKRYSKLSDKQLEQYNSESFKKGSIRGGVTTGNLNKTNGQLSKAGRISAKKQWDENRNRELEKCSMGGKANAVLSSKITIMCDIDGNHIKTFKNRKDAAKYVNGFASTLKNVLNNPTRTYKGYRWID